MSTSESQPPAIGKAATFIRGFNLFQTFQLCLVGSSFAMRRFGYEEEAVGTFIPLCLNAMEILFTVAHLTTIFITAPLKACFPGVFAYIASGMSMVSACFSVLVNVLLLRTYALDDSVDNITRYYWLILLCHFAAGIDMQSLFTNAGQVISYFECGASSLGLAITCFHWMGGKILQYRGMNVDYWLIVCQLAFAVCLSVVAAVIWIAFLIQDKILATSSGGGKGNGGVKPMGFLKSLPMLIGCTIGLSTLLSVFPTIAPFELVEFQHAYPVLMCCIVADTVAGFVIWALGQYTSANKVSWYSHRNVWWHSFWLLFIPYLGIGYLFLRCMHYPESGLGQAVVGRPLVAGFLTVMYFVLGRFLFGVSLPAVFGNAEGLAEIIMPMGLGIRQICLNTLKYMSEAHVQQLRLAKETYNHTYTWPTDGMSKHSALRYWISTAAKVGYANFREMSTADVKQRLGGVARHIVSYRKTSTVA